MSPASHDAPTAPGASTLALLFAVAAPPLLAFNLSPSATLLNQLLAFFGWGLVLMGAGAPWGDALQRARWALCALAGLGVGVLWSMARELPGTLGASALATLAVSALVLASAAGRPDDRAAHDVASALLVAGVLSALIGLLQVFAPAWIDGTWVARSGLPGRAVGNLRQPNHLSSLLVWALVALVPLAREGRWFRWRLPAPVAAAVAVLLVWAVVLTASRTGVLGMVILAGWGLVDRRLPRRLRLALLLAPLAYGLAWLGMDLWAQRTAHAFGGTRMEGGGDISSSRFGIWANAWALLAAQPWQGVGFGEFNHAWTLAVLPGRPVAFFDHTHNLPLQLVVELGWPLGGAVLLALLVALGVAARRAWSVPGEGAGVRARAAWMMVLLIGVHSLLEYPLWYAYFLLPASWALGHALSAAPSAELPEGPAEGDAEATLTGRAWALTGAAVVAGSVFALNDYGRVVDVFTNGDGRSTLQERIARGQGSVFFGHHADYAAATVSDTPGRELNAVRRASHALIDTRLLIAWIKALDETGHRDQARYLAARLREFRNPDAADFLGACTAAPASAVPVQCEPPSRPYAVGEFGR